MKVKQIVQVALLASILFVQEQLLSFLPNIQLTIFIILLYSKCLKFKETLLIILIHVVLDNLLNGSFIHYIVIPMFIGYFFILVFTHIFLKNAESPLILASCGVIFSIVYSLSFLICNVIMLDINPVAYLISDISFTTLLIVSSFLSILWLYLPLKKILDTKIQNN